MTAKKTTTAAKAGGAKTTRRTRSAPPDLGEQTGGRRAHWLALVAGLLAGAAWVLRLLARRRAR